ncbi:MAG: 30S ribosomal protein S6 [Cyanobacteria bacterium P01_H01_bin.15]
MLSNYEMLYILRPDMTEDTSSKIVDKFRDRLGELGVFNLDIKIWGRRRLAYEIQRHQDGIYVQMNYVGDGKQIAPLEKDMGYSEDVMRYMTLKLDTPVDAENLVPVEPSPSRDSQPEPAPEPVTSTESEAPAPVAETDSPAESAEPEAAAPETSDEATETEPVAETV